MDVFRKYATDTKREIEGVWKELDGGAKVLVARSGNRRYMRLLSKEMERYAAQLDERGPDGSPTDAAQDIDEQIITDVMASSVLLGWEGLEYDGEPLTYSVENAKKFLAIKDFRGVIQRLAQNFENFRAYQEEKQAKNSPPA